jgi:hypothetical protein
VIYISIIWGPNASFIQKDLAVELGLNIDKSKKYDVAGAKLSRTFGMIKGVSIELTSNCVITEDLTVRAPIGFGNYQTVPIGFNIGTVSVY